jgi:hypothetical protein
VRRLRAASGFGGVLVAALAALASAAPAGAARTLTLNDTAHLRLTSKHKFTLNEQGSASGTISGPIYIHLNIVSTNRVTAEVSIYSGGSSLTGYATATYRPAGGVASFDGAMSIARGSGRYRHVHATGLSFTGTVQRLSDAVSVHVYGKLSI